MSFLDALMDLVSRREPLAPDVLDTVHNIVAMADPMVRAAPQLERLLAEGAAHALHYCSQLVDALPGPLEINRHAFSNDPVMHALFATANDIEDMLGRSQAMRDYLAHSSPFDGEYCYAMLAARRWQKKQLGMACHGNLIRNDVPQEVLYFSGHTLVAPGADIDATRNLLRNKALESLMYTFNQHVERIRRERDALRADLAVENVQMATLNLRPGSEEETVHSQHLVELDVALRQHGDALMPEHLARALADLLRHPERALRLEPLRFQVDRLGVLHDPADQEGQTIEIPELKSRDRRLHVAVLVCVSRAEAQAAVQAAQEKQKRYVII